MPYPIVADTAARLWWKTWADNDTADPPAPPEADTSPDGAPHDWSGLVQSLVDDLGALYARVEGGETASRRGLVGRIAEALGARGDGDAPMSNDRFEAAASVAVHSALPRDAALADPEFWIWMATGPGQALILRRYPPRRTTDDQGVERWKIPDRKNFTSSNAQETLFYRLWIRAELAHDPALGDPYELARYGDIDFWRSHVLRQKLTEAGPVLRAFIRHQYPDGPDGKRRSSVAEIRQMIKHMKRAAANVMVEALDDEEAARFVEEQWRKTQTSKVRPTAAE